MPTAAANTRRRAVEFAVLFIAAPVLLAWVMRPGMLFPAIWLLGALCFVLLWFDPDFDRRALWRWPGVRPALAGIAARFLIGAAALTILLLLDRPDRFLHLPRTSPGLWALIMLLYPLASVYPQELAFRAFLFHRYAGLFRGRAALILASALAFGFAHILLHNWWAVGLSTVGGVLFGWTYARSRSLAAPCLEHSLYGCFLFTIGWGPYFYAGTFGRG